MKINDLFDLTHTSAADYLSGFTYPWEALGGIKEYIKTLACSLDRREYNEVAPGVWVHKTAEIASSAYLG